MEATLRVTPEELMELIRCDVGALYQIMDAIENAETLLGETKEVITGEESDQVLSKSMIYLNKVREQIVGMIDYCRSLEEVCVSYMNVVYASPDVPLDHLQ